MITQWSGTTRQTQIDARAGFNGNLRVEPRDATISPTFPPKDAFDDAPAPVKSQTRNP